MPVYVVDNPLDPVSHAELLAERLAETAASIMDTVCDASVRHGEVYPVTIEVRCENGASMSVYCEANGCQAVLKHRGVTYRCAISCYCLEPLQACSRNNDELVMGARRAALILAAAGVPAESGTRFWRAP